MDSSDDNMLDANDVESVEDYFYYAESDDGDYSGADDYGPYDVDDASVDDDYNFAGDTDDDDAALRPQKGKVFASELKEAMKELARYGVKVSIEDIEHLSVLCPKVVGFVDSYVESSSFGNAILIINSSKEDEHQVGDHTVFHTYLIF